MKAGRTSHLGLSNPMNLQHKDTLSRGTEIGPAIQIELIEAEGAKAKRYLERDSSSSTRHRDVLARLELVIQRGTAPLTRCKPSEDGPPEVT